MEFVIFGLFVLGLFGSGMYFGYLWGKEAGIQEAVNHA